MGLYSHYASAASDPELEEALSKASPPALAVDDLDGWRKLVDGITPLVSVSRIKLIA